MRRWRGLVAAALSTVALAGCGTPAGLDGDLTDDWRPVGAVTQFAPKAGDCHLIAAPTSYLTSYQPVDCARAHLVETFHLGTFTGPLAERPTPPKVGSAALRPAFAECAAKATAFVGGDWRGARLTIQVVPPSPPGWQGGARWFRCDMYELNAIDGDPDYAHGQSDLASQHAGSLRGALKGASPLAYGCLTTTSWDSFLQTSCTKSHQYEYVGTWTAPDGRFEEAAAGRETSIHARCRTLVARYAKVPVDRALPYRTGTAFRLPSEEAWARGDRGIRCFYWSSGKKVTRSIRGGGPRVLPIG
ncbi:septum formation family protein [Micromonospora soli]|uniref:septum formation family protein n=1 Tax=Micromonospora sp. NBRC 110009 TaxID=3061627 RepID=UPI002673D4FB|nr:septum formation family protein [Micromonospora sp. NBRC 110009]WKT95997.1 septum formation family protein [Micromonospora sp. NBRC 110009]